MRFKDWLAEWEGNAFMQAPEFTNGPIFQAAGARSKYVPTEKRKSDDDDDDDDEDEDEDDDEIDSDEETEMEKIKSLFGFTKDDELDELRKKVRRKKE